MCLFQPPPVTELCTLTKQFKGYIKGYNSYNILCLYCRFYLCPSNDIGIYFGYTVLILSIYDRRAKIYPKTDSSSIIYIFLPLLKIQPEIHGLCFRQPFNLKKIFQHPQTAVVRYGLRLPILKIGNVQFVALEHDISPWPISMSMGSPQEAFPYYVFLYIIRTLLPTQTFLFY